MNLTSEAKRLSLKHKFILHLFNTAFIGILPFLFFSARYIIPIGRSAQLCCRVKRATSKIYTCAYIFKENGPPSALTSRAYSVYRHVVTKGSAACPTQIKTPNLIFKWPLLEKHYRYPSILPMELSIVWYVPSSPKLENAFKPSALVVLTV